MEPNMIVIIDSKPELFHFRGITLTAEEMQSLVNIHKAHEHNKGRPNQHLPHIFHYEDVGKLEPWTR